MPLESEILAAARKKLEEAEAARRAAEAEWQQAVADARRNARVRISLADLPALKLEASKFLPSGMTLGVELAVSMGLEAMAQAIEARIQAG